MRQNILGICSIILSAFYFSSGARAVELRDATNQQILDELAIRLQTGGGGNGGSAVNYLCDPRGNFTFSVVGPTGSEKSEKIYIGDQNFCQQQSNFLATHRNRITSTSIIAICDSSYMNRYSITASGEINTLERQYFGDMNSCLRQAQSNNSIL